MSMILGITEDISTKTQFKLYEKVRYIPLKLKPSVKNKTLHKLGRQHTPYAE